jgi:hypothetical protein
MKKEPSEQAPLVTENVAASLKSTLKAVFGSSVRSIRTEIQDGGLFLLVSAELAPQFSEEKLISLIEQGAAIIKSRIPPRLDEYSSMLNLTLHGQIKKTSSGG